MCGRITQLGDFSSVKEKFKVTTPKPGLVRPRYNLAPGQAAAMIVAVDGRRKLDFLTWGLIPAWVKDVQAAQRSINARAETVWEKASFKNAIRYRRGLIPSDGFYEWGRTGPSKHPFLFQREDGEPLALAGIWEAWNDRDGGEWLTFCMLTRAADSFMRRFHDRMPVIVDSDQADAWLDHRLFRAADLNPIMQENEGPRLIATPVSSRVNAVAHDDAACMEATGPVITSETPIPPKRMDPQQSFDW